MTTIEQNQNSAQKTGCAEPVGIVATPCRRRSGDLEPADTGGNECAVASRRVLSERDHINRIVRGLSWHSASSPRWLMIPTWACSIPFYVPQPAR